MLSVLRRPLTPVTWYGSAHRCSRMQRFCRPARMRTGHPRMFAPNPVQGGSSVSHWDTVLTPSQLMEPNITSGLSHSVRPPQDLTFSLLTDVGWCVSNCPPPPPPPSPTPTPSPPANDNFANAQLISGCSGSVTGTNVAATKEPANHFTNRMTTLVDVRFGISGPLRHRRV